jgi:hypothetical protein
MRIANLCTNLIGTQETATVMTPEQQDANVRKH